LRTSRAKAVRSRRDSSIGNELPLDSAGRPDWSKRSVQLSLFDVTDLAKPARTAQALVGTAWAYSEALWDHRAFNWYRPRSGQATALFSRTTSP